MNEKNKQKRFVITPAGKAWLEEDAQGKYVVLISDPPKPYHKGVRLTFYADEIYEMEEK